MQVASNFLQLLRAYPVEEFDQQPGSVIGTWSDFKVGYLNDGWSKFAQENDGAVDRWGIGACLLDAIPAVLSPFYRNHFAAVLRDDRPWEHIYECSSPKLLRLFHMLVLPLENKQGLLMFHSLRRETTHEPGHEDVIAGKYEDSNGILHQCAHCRRTRRNDEDVWDWLPEFVRNPRPNTSHGLCRPCFAFYYNEGRRVFPRSISTVDPPINQNEE